MLKRLPKSLAFLFWMTILTGVLYPAFVTLAGQLLFPKAANGNLLVMDGQVRGSSLLAQKFEKPGFFHARPSASDYAYLGAGASNLGPVSADLAAVVKARREAWNAGFGSPVPEDMLFASASGLDPDISPEAALAQIDSVAAARGLDGAARSALRAHVEASVSSSLIGPPRVNSVKLNAWLEGG